MELISTILLYSTLTTYHLIKKILVFEGNIIVAQLGEMIWDPQRHTPPKLVTSYWG